MTEISNSQFFSNSNPGFDMWKTASSGALWEQPTTTPQSSTTPSTPNNIGSGTSNPLKSSSGSFILKSASSPSTITSPTSTSVNVNGVSTTTSSTHSHSHPPLLHTTSYSQLQVPSSIKNSQFINITSTLGTSSSSTTGAGGVDNSNWLSHSDSFVQPPLKRGLIKAYSDADIQPPLSIQQQIQQAQAQQAQQDLENEQEDIEDEITGQNRYKTELCRSFQETGVCRYGLKCQFAHGRDELRNVMRHPKYKTETCKTFYSIGSCPYGSRCRFIHTRDPEHSITLGMSQLSCSNGNVSPPSNGSVGSISSNNSNNSNSSSNSSNNNNNNIINGNIIYSNTPASFASEVLLSKALPQMIRQHSSPQLQTPLYILQQQKELQQQQKDQLKEQLREQKELQFKEKEQQQQQYNIKESPTKQQHLPPQQPHPTTVHWSNSWSSDEASSTAPNSNFSQLKSSAPPILKKEESSKRLAIFKTICSNSTW